ncbi:SDR family NAD(P)-dependent oxidoreductase [Paenibacillus eucommiae]|uniref:NAD(P)-dependent dehydrogenase (Short-subunit alcohol dehydrogenase family) n=1 Tax=Paenibacillus eucommiae TaxID=1355755 RepID=A0ABS4J270_9BACL|nr:SDR family oxidoreductase [Paenibacillus eucommiae]MBP1992909.1 NAD(P)-dependent dehydrogenase (short-subunit alcohol dehydrogenase family) [Paenibacillus eucommiae]
MKWKNKVVIVTGAAQGIGKALALAYGEQEARVVVADLHIEACEVVADAICRDGGQAVSVATDVRQIQAIENLIQQATEAFGTVDIMINNAGIGRWKSPYELSMEDWSDVIATNLTGTFLCAREAAKVMKAHKHGGSIINIASTRAIMSEPNSEAYAAAKGGIVALTHALAVSLGSDSIRVNCISPGWIETGDYEALRVVDHEQHPAGRVGRVSDIVKACFYLTDADNDFVTGTNLVVDGGMTRRMIYEE